MKINLKQKLAALKHAVKMRHYFEYVKAASPGERTYDAVCLLAVLIVTVLLLMKLVSVCFIINVAEHEERADITLEKFEQRYVFSERMIEEQNAVLQHLVSVEATVQKVYLESIPREKWGEGISLLTDNAHEGNENLEFYYYEGDQLVLKSGNASDPGLDSTGRSSLLASGKPLFDEQQYNMYAATALGDGMLLSMYRAVGALSAMNVRSLTGAEKLTGSSELIAYADDTGAVYSLSGDGITDSNIHDPQYREIFDNYVPAGSEDWGFFEILDNRGKYIMSTVELADNLKLSAYFSVEECFKTALYEMLLPAVLFVLGTAVLTLGALRSRLVRDPVRAVGEYTCLHGNIYISTR